MLKILVRGRGTGKTSEIITAMALHPSMITLVHSVQAIELYPEHLQKRVFTVSQFNKEHKKIMALRFYKPIIPLRLAGTSINKEDVMYRTLRIDMVTVDEPFMVPPTELAQMMYILGQLNLETTLVGSDMVNPQE